MKNWSTIIMTAALASTGAAASAEIPLWPEGVPRIQAKRGAEKPETRAGDEIFLRNIHVPGLYHHRAPADRRTGASILIFPGGGYGGLSMTKEGHDVAGWFNTIGVDGFVVKNRVSPYRHPVPLMDAQRAIRIVRSRAREWGIDPNRIGIMGFSAGGHLASTAATHFDMPVITEGALGKVSCRPDFVVLGYPVVSFVDPKTCHKGSRNNLLGKEQTPELRESLSAERNITARTPPMFLFHAKNDGGVPVGNSIALKGALERAGVAVGIHTMKDGGHGFGMHHAEWTESCARWLAGQRLIPEARLASDVEVTGHGFDEGILFPGVRAYGNRKYVFGGIPQQLRGWRFTRLDGGERARLRARATADATVHIATASGQAGIDLASWERVEGLDFYYTDKGRTRMHVFAREVRGGDTITIPQGNWSGAMVIAPRMATVRVEPAAGLSAVPGVAINHVPAKSRTYVGSPGLAILPDGSYVASHDLFGPATKEHARATTLVFRSADRGATWSKIATIEGAFWSTLFVHRGALYLMGADRHYGNTVIRRSTDGGTSWTEPRDGITGLLLADGGYHCAPVPVLIHGGRIWRGMEDNKGPARGWGKHFRAFMMSASVDADLLAASSWRSSNRLARDPKWLEGKFNGWLEGNAVATPDGKIVDILRVSAHGIPEKAAIIEIADEGRTAHFDPRTGFVDFPGGAKKFAIRLDGRSGYYWTLSNFIPERHFMANTGMVRNTLALVRSRDLRTWEVRCIVIYHPDQRRHGFQYVEWLFDDDDIIAASRTAYDDGLGGAHNEHDANFLTFHRIERFRELTRDDPCDAWKRELAETE